MPPLPWPASDSRRDSSAGLYSKNSRLARSAFPCATPGARRRRRYDPLGMGLKTGLNRSKKPRAGLVRLQSSPIGHSNLCRTEFRDRPCRRLHKTAYCDFLRSPKPLQKPPLLQPHPLIPLMRWREMLQPCSMNLNIFGSPM